MVILLGVTVSIPAMLSAAEGDGAVSVCVTLDSGATERTEQDFIVMLTTTDGSGKFLQLCLSRRECDHHHNYSNEWF